MSYKGHDYDAIIYSRTTNKPNCCPYCSGKKGDRMKFLEMIRKTTIVQRILIGVSIVWILWKPRGLGDFLQGLILIVIVWGLYWIITEFMKQRKNK